MADLNFEVCHALANEYFCFHCDNKRSFTHNISNNRFVLWIYFNDDDEFYGEQELGIILQLATDHKLDENGWDKHVTLTTHRATHYEIFDNVVAIIFSPKKER